MIWRTPLQKAQEKIYGLRGHKPLLLPALLPDSTLEQGFIFDCPAEYTPVEALLLALTLYLQNTMS